VDDGHRRGRILRALATCMAEKGYPATTIADIARAGRVSKTVVYAHFRDKEECLLELYARATDQVMGTVAGAKQAARDEGLPWRDRVRVVIGALDAEYAMFGVCVRDTEGAERAYMYTDFGGAEMGLAAQGQDIFEARVADNGFGWVIVADPEGKILRRTHNEAA